MIISSRNRVSNLLFSSSCINWLNATLATPGLLATVRNASLCVRRAGKPIASPSSRARSSDTIGTRDVIVILPLIVSRSSFALLRAASLAGVADPLRYRSDARAARPQKIDVAFRFAHASPLEGMDSNPRSPGRRTTLFETPLSQHARAPPPPSKTLAAPSRGQHHLGRDAAVHQPDAPRLAVLPLARG